MSERPQVHPVFLCGGSGTRLWPLSRKSYPKQFAAILGDESLFQGSARRLTGEGFSDPIVVTGDPYRFVVGEQLTPLGVRPDALMIEPEGRNTAPAILAAALWQEKSDPEALMLVAPSDHVIPDHAGFREAVFAATNRALEGDLVTFGIRPDRPETGYGYLLLADDGNPASDTPQKLASFIEKPDADAAEKMVADHRYLWNAGIFLFKVRTLVEAYKAHAPEVLTGVRRAVDAAKGDLGFIRLDAAAWATVPDISVDYAIMEKAGNLSVMPYGGKWSDLGSWEAVWQDSNPDGDGMVVSQNATAIDCKGSLLRSESDRLELVGIGLTDTVAIATSDAIVIAPRAESQRVKEAVAALKARGARQATEFPRDFRPWGWYESLAMGSRFQVKRIVVHPGASLSLQSHHHRSEHWIVVEGTARVTVNEDVKLVTENESVYIPLGAVHRMENPGKFPMVLIEVQTGSYLGEDDIVRYEDIYARA